MGLTRPPLDCPVYGRWTPQPFLAIAHRVDRRVDGDQERRAARHLGALHQIAGGAAIAIDVELEPGAPTRRAGDVLEPRGRERADDERGAGRAGAARGFRLGAAVDAPLRGDRGEQDREVELLAEELEPGVELAHVGEHARSQPERVERLAVPAKRDLVRRALGDVVPDGTRQTLACHRLELEDVDGRRGSADLRALRARHGRAREPRHGAERDREGCEELSAIHPCLLVRVGALIPRKRKQLFQVMSSWTSAGRPSVRSVLSTGCSGAM